MALTIRDHVGDGVTSVYNIDFALGYIDKTHIYVYLDGDPFATQLAYTWVNATQIQITTPVDTDVTFHIRRVVPRSQPALNYTDGALLREANLDASFAQTLMILEEIEDGCIDTSGVFIVNSDLDMVNNHIRNLPDPTLDSDPITLGYQNMNYQAVQTVVDNLESVYNYADTYLNAHATPPTTRHDGSPLLAGDVYVDTANSMWYFYNEGIWNAAAQDMSDHEQDTTAHPDTSITHDNTTSGLTATNVGQAINEIAVSLGTAANKDFGNADDELPTTLQVHDIVTPAVHAGKHMTYAGTPNAIILTSVYTQPIRVLSVGMGVTFIATATNTGDTTINMDGTGEVQCTTTHGATLPSGFIRIGERTHGYYNGTTIVIQPAITQLLHVQDRKAAGTDGGTSTSTGQVRSINTVLTNEIPAATLSSDVITLPAGRYEATIGVPAYRTDAHRARLFDITGNTTLLLGGGSNYASNTGASSDVSTITGRFTLSVTSSLQVRHWTTISVADNGLGVASDDGYGTDDEIYTDVLIRRI